MDCIFCKIIKNEKESRKLFENDKISVILDAFPVNEGHLLVIPKKHFKNINETPDEILTELITAIKKLSKLEIDLLDADDINIITAPSIIPHFHFHIVPRFSYDLMGPIADLDNKREFSKKKMDEIEEKIKNKIKEMGF